MSIVLPVTSTHAAGTPEDNAPGPVTTTWRATYETWKLGDSDRMGVVGANLLFDVNPNVKLGIGSYGAVVGNWGGFITLGLAGELQTPVLPHIILLPNASRVVLLGGLNPVGFEGVL